MTKALNFTEQAITRTINGARKNGIKVGVIITTPDGKVVAGGAVMIAADGAIVVLDEALVPTVVPSMAPKADDQEADNWANA